MQKLRKYSFYHGRSFTFEEFCAEDGRSFQDRDYLDFSEIWDSLPDAEFQSWTLGELRAFIMFLSQRLPFSGELYSVASKYIDINDAVTTMRQKFTDESNGYMQDVSYVLGAWPKKLYRRYVYQSGVTQVHPESSDHELFNSNAFKHIRRFDSELAQLYFTEKVCSRLELLFGDEIGSIVPSTGIVG